MLSVFAAYLKLLLTHLRATDDPGLPRIIRIIYAIRGFS
jgi:hypothetical protein